MKPNFRKTRGAVDIQFILLEIIKIIKLTIKKMHFKTLTSTQLAKKLQSRSVSYCFTGTNSFITSNYAANFVLAKFLANSMISSTLSKFGPEA